VNQQSFELLAPGGDVESIKAAIAAGADAVYCGLDRFNARNRATNISLDTLKQILPLAHQHQCKIFLTLNIALLESEVPTMIRLLEQLNKSDIDGVIIQDLGLASLLQRHFPELDVHASTQLNTHNPGQILMMKQLGVSRVNLARELNIDEIKSLADFGHQHNVLMEVFVHGSYCVGFSGLCYISSARNGASGNRGRCSQPCRDPYQPTDVGVSHPLNLKDNSAYLDLPALADAGVYSLKIEGRIKKPHYVYSVVEQWRKQIDQYRKNGQIFNDTSPLYKVFNRDFSAGYLHNSIGKGMFIDNPRNNAAHHFATTNNQITEQQLSQAKSWIYDQTTQLMQDTEHAILTLEQNGNDLDIVEIKRASVPFIPIKPSNHENDLPVTTTLSVLISNVEDAKQLTDVDCELYFQLPNTLAKQSDQLDDLFDQYPNLIPYFPSIVIGEDYAAADAFLDRHQPAKIVTNNTGIGYLAHQKGIKWIAGPQLNLMNGYAMLVLQQQFGCSGAFISNEINKLQLKRITKPANYELLYSLYHPNDLMVSRQCLFQQTSGCKKLKLNKGCLPRCEKSTSIINLNGSGYVIDKKMGELNHIFAERHYFNDAVLADFPNRFDGVMIDLRDITTQTRYQLSKPELIKQFQNAISHNAMNQIHEVISATECNQYQKGL
jgi:putative protease